LLFGLFSPCQVSSSMGLSSFLLPSSLKEKPKVRSHQSLLPSMKSNNPIEALAASTVKVAGRDVLATWKVLISLGAAPILYSFYAFLATLIAIKANAPLKWRIWTPFLTMAILPIIGYFALKFGEAGIDVLKYVPSI
jgi:glycerol-3-phosphate O-acyltransferase/dihydroxyacetone phosphate acyltransferase